MHEAADETTLAADARSCVASESRRTLITAAALAVLAPVIAELLFEPRYLTADDPAMDMMVRGTFLTSGTSSIMLFQNSLIGVLLSTLYGITQDVSWYRLLQMFVQILASSQIHRIALRNRPTGFAIGASLMYLLAFDLPFYINAQFTITSAIGGVAGICLLQFHLLNKIPLTRTTAVVAVALCSASFLIRFNAFAMICLVSLPISLWIFVEAIRDRDNDSESALLRWKPYAACLTVATLLFIGFSIFDNFWYANSDWRDFRRWNRNRVAITDNLEFIYTEEKKPMLDEIGWTENDYNLFINLLYVDSEIFTSQKVERLLQLGRESGIGGASKQIGRTQYDMGRPTLPQLITSLQFPPTLAMLAAAIWLSLSSMARRTFLPTAAMLATTIALVFYLIYGLNRLPDRLLQPLLVCVVVQNLVLSTSLTKPASVLTWVLIGLISLQPLSVFSQETDERIGKHAELTGTLNGLPLDDDDILIFLSLSIRKHSLGIWDDKRCIGRHRNYFIHISSLPPFHNRRLQGLGIDDVPAAMVEREDVYVLANEFLYELLVTYYREHHSLEINRNVVFEPEQDSSIGFKVFQLTATQLDVSR